MSRRLRTLARALLTPLLPSLAIAMLAAPVQAATITALLEPFTGDPAAVRVTLDDGVDPGNLQVTVEVVDGIGDIRGVFFHILDESLLSGLSVIGGSQVTQSAFRANDIIRLGGGNNLQGGGSPCPCDIGVEIGNPGIGHGDDFQTTVFTLTHADGPLFLEQFSEQLVGVRLTSVGLDGKEKREGSSKLRGTFSVVPEPSTGALLGLGLGALALRRRGSRKAA